MVQCLNRGSDGYDVQVGDAERCHVYLRFVMQWECKTEMDSDYQFGRIQVLCEGYDSPNDAYVLRGSCGVKLDHVLVGRA